MKTWSRAALSILLGSAVGCGGAGAKIAQESENGGIVVYPYQTEQGPVLSAFRKEAVQLIEQRCRAGHTIVREGESRGRSRLSGPVESGGELVREHRWGIQFQCK